MDPQKNQYPTQGFKWLNLTQFGGALNDNFLKLTIIYALALFWEDTNPEKEKQILSIIGIAFSLPFLLFLGFAGTLADKYSKSKITQYSKLAEIVITLFALAALFMQSPILLVITAFIMSTQSAFFSPSKYGIIPELTGPQNVSKANGLIQAATYLAIIGGTVLAPSMTFLSNNNFVAMGTLSILIALLGYIFSLKIPRTPPAGGTELSSPWILPDIVKGLKYIHKDSFLALAVWGSAAFSFIAGFAQLNILSYGTEHLHMGNSAASTWLFLFIAFGIGGGSLLAGKLSKGGIEFGLVPIGVGILTTCSFSLALLPEKSLVLGAALCLTMGFGAGLFIVPIEAFLQFRTEAHKRGAVIATAGWLSWVGILLAALLIGALPTLSLSSAQGFFITGAILLSLFILSILILPDFLLKLFGLLVTRLFYRVRVSGQENIPATGPAVLVANHSSLLDAALLLACTPRRIRFLMETEYIQESSSILQKIFQTLGVIPISKKSSPKDLITSIKAARKALEDGFLVGIFPEGALSRTGHLLPFQLGYLKITQKTNAPIIPAFIEGAFDTYASYAHTNTPKILDKRDIKKPLSVLFGKPLLNTTPPDTLQKEIQSLCGEAAFRKSQLTGSLGKQFVQSAKTHWKKAAISEASGRTITYGKTLTGTLLLQKLLNKKIPSEEKIIGILLPPSLGATLANLALTLSEKTTANLNYTLSPEALISCIHTAQIQTIITSRAFTKKTGINPQTEGLKTLYLEDLLQSASPQEKLWAFFQAYWLPPALLSPNKKWKPSELATILFSSGSTALPKGIMLSHLNIQSNIQAFGALAKTQKEDCLLGVLPFFHSMGYTTTLWFPILKGMEIAYHHHPLECDAIEKLCKERKISILIGTPTFLLAWTRKLEKDSLKSLRWTCVGAEKLRPKLAEMFEKKFGVPPMEGYGTTECSPVIAVNIPNACVDGISQEGFKPGSVGKALPNLLCEIVNRETLQPLPQGEEGLLRVKGPSIMLGYLNSPQKTQEVLQDGWYNTGDIAKIDENGFITITDRLSRFSKIGGEMVSHSAVEEEIKKALLERTGNLAVFSLPDEKKGEKLFVAYETTLGSPQELHKATLAAPFPNLWKPSQKSWLPVDALPLLGSGKLDLPTLKALALTKNHEES